jgi:hypothetical protein
VATKYEIKQFATGPPLTGRLRDSKGFVAIAGATVTLHFQRLDASTGPVRGGVVTNLDDNTMAKRGKFEYDWANGDTLIPGLHRMEFKVLYLDGTVEFFPDEGFDLLDVVPSLAA